MRGIYPVEKLRKYPHLMVSDIRVWEEYVGRMDPPFDRFEYDVHVGEGIKVREEWEESIKRMALALSEKRIDVVGWKGRVPTIIEVKPSASLSAIGQVLSYRELYWKRWPENVRPKVMIVTDIEMPDTKWLCNQFGIHLVVVERQA